MSQIVNIESWRKPAMRKFVNGKWIEIQILDESVKFKSDPIDKRYLDEEPLCPGYIEEIYLLIFDRKIDLAVKSFREATDEIKQALRTFK